MRERTKAFLTAAMCLLEEQRERMVSIRMANFGETREQAETVYDQMFNERFETDEKRGR